MPGLGQVYNGQLRKGAFFLGLVLLIPFLFGITMYSTTFLGLVVAFMLELSLRLYAAIDGARVAKHQKDYILKPYNTWYYHLLIAIGMYAILIVYDINAVMGIKSFRIPTVTNHPTLQVGDRVVADLKAYENKDPDYGDIVIFLAPDGLFHTYRIVGLPNDEFELVDNIVRINGALSNTKVLQELTFEHMPVVKIEEELPNGTKHLMYKLGDLFNNPVANVPGTKIPPDHYYLLGDNRDNAADSRFLGLVHRTNIQGRVIYSYWGKSLNRINIDFRDK